MSSSEHVTLRVARPILERVEELREWVEGNASLTPSGSASRSDVLRIALLRGVELLERERRKDGAEK
jgi:hypothetical protein